MLRKINQDHAIIFVCAEDGCIKDLLFDAKGFFTDHALTTLEMFMTPESRLSYQKFIHDTIKNGQALRQDITLQHKEKAELFSFFSINNEGKILVLALQSPQYFFVIYEQFLEMFNEQSRALRESQLNFARYQAKFSRKINDQHLKDYMLLNNELTNMHRELSIKNSLLKMQEKRFRDLVIYSPDAQLVIDSDSRILFFNPAAEKMLKLTDNNAMGTIFTLDLSQEREVCLSAEESHIWTEVRATEITWDAVPAKLVSLRDITERKQVEFIKEDVQRIAQHDLITPLTPIISLPQLLADDDNLTTDQKQMLTMVSAAGNRILNMIRESLNFYKMELGTYVFTPEPVNLLVTFQDILFDLSNHLRSKAVRVVISINGNLIQPTDTFWVMAEPTLCYSLFSNLVLNSIEASPREGVVSISLDQDRLAHIRIHNFGVVPVHIQPKFFDKYVSSGKTHGTGLGTYSAKRIATTMGGTIQMESSEESGTILTVTFDATVGAKRPTEGIDAKLPMRCAEHETTSHDVNFKFTDPVREALVQLQYDVEQYAFTALEKSKKILTFFNANCEQSRILNTVVASLVDFDFKRAHEKMQALMNSGNDQSQEKT
jgi:signal transduction histidine kinase